MHVVWGRASRRSVNLSGLSDGELYQAFDLTYDYDIWPIWQAAVVGQAPVARYLEMLRFQDAIYPDNFVKMRCVENHDQLRIQRLAPSLNQALALSARRSVQLRRVHLRRAGGGRNAHAFALRRGQGGKGRFAFAAVPDNSGAPQETPGADCGQVRTDERRCAPIQAAWQGEHANLFGLFNVMAATGAVEVPLPDGDYADLLSGATVSVRAGQVSLPAAAVILAYAEPLPLQPFHSQLLDFHLPVMCP